MATTPQVNTRPVTNPNLLDAVSEGQGLKRTTVWLVASIVATIAATVFLGLGISGMNIGGISSPQLIEASLIALFPTLASTVVSGIFMGEYKREKAAVDSEKLPKKLNGEQVILEEKHVKKE